MNMIKELATALIITAAIITGVIVRAEGGIPLIQSELIYAVPEDGTIPDPDDPAAAVRRFYLLFDRGMYEEAWSLSLEHDWIGDKTIRFRDEVVADDENFFGWTGKEEFIERCMNDLGPAGVFLSLSHLRTKSVKRSLSDLPSGQARMIAGIESVYEVRASGDFLASCAVYRWKKDVYVLKIGDEYKVLLDGTKGRRELFHMNWLNFSEKQLIRELRSQ